VLLRHPRDSPRKRDWELPANCAEIGPKDWEHKLAAVRAAPFVVTDYSNLGYSLALAGKPVRYVFEDPLCPDSQPLVHLAVELGRQGLLPVKHSNVHDIDLDGHSAEPPAGGWLRPQLDVRELEQFLRTLPVR
jgi:hypothetical protein